MSIFFIKSLLSLAVTALAVTAVFTMFEIFGRKEKKYKIEKMKTMHRISGIIYFILFAVISYFCLDFMLLTKAELSTRSTFHGLCALAIVVLFGLKILYLRVYRQFYEQVKIIGLLMALITFGMVGTSAGYYLLVSEFGTDKSFDKVMQYKMQLAMAKDRREAADAQDTIPVKTDPEHIGRGKNLFDSKCGFCHYANSTETTVGPGLKGILKNPKLPVSKRPATPGNIIKQLKEPVNRMPSFEYLTDEEIADIIAYLNAL
jgi:mono/diheme cytochrome c family protein